MSPFKKKKYTNPIICHHNNDLSKDWYVFFRFKNEGKIHSYKRREGINRIKELNNRLFAINILKDEIEFDLKHGWNPIMDPQREIDYSPYLNNVSTNSKESIATNNLKKDSRKEKISKYYFK